MVEWVRDVTLKNQASIVFRGHPGVVVREKDVTISTFIPPGLAERLATFPPDHYLLGVGYASKGDLQLGVTGTAQRGEYARAALAREVQEELGMDPCRAVSMGQVAKGRRTYYFYTGDFTSLDRLGFRVCDDTVSPNKSKKVVLLIHGPRDAMEDLLLTIGSLPGRPSDGIDRFAAIPLPDAIHLAKTLPSTC